MSHGYNFDLGVADGNPQLAPLADLPALYSKIAAIKPKLFRIMCPWNFVAKAQTPGSAVPGTVPPTTTGRDWTYVDRCINEILLYTGADILMIIGQGRPSWGGFAFLWFSFGATVGNATDYGNFVTECVNRYKPGGVGIRTDGIYAPNAGKGVTHWEVWNEQNSQLWGANVNPTDYTAYLKAAYTAIKALQPGGQSTVVFGGLQHVQREPQGYWGYGSNNLDELTFLSRCYDAGAKGYFDVLATHVYTQTDTESPPVGYPGSTPGPAPAVTNDNWLQLLALRALMVAKSDVHDMWITEVGYATQNLSEALQKTYMQQLLGQLNMLAYVKAVILYNVRDMGTDKSNVENTWGFLHYDFTPKALFAFLTSLVTAAPPQFTLSVAPALGMSGARTGTAAFGLAATPSLAFAAAERYVASFALAVSPSFGFGTPQPPVFDAAGGASNYNGFTGSIGCSWTHTCGSGPNRVGLVQFLVRSGGQSAAPGAQARTVTWGGVAMSLVSQVQPGGAGSEYCLEVWQIVNPPAGASTVAATVGNGGNTGRAIACVSMSYTGVNQTTPLGPPTTATGNGTAEAVTLASSTINLPIVAFGAENGGNISFGSGSTRRGYQGSGDGFATVAGGDAVGAASVPFTATAGGVQWAAIAMNVIPA